MIIYGASPWFRPLCMLCERESRRLGRRRHWFLASWNRRLVTPGEHFFRAGNGKGFYWTNKFCRSTATWIFWFTTSIRNGWRIAVLRIVVRSDCIQTGVLPFTGKTGRRFLPAFPWRSDGASDRWKKAKEVNSACLCGIQEIGTRPSFFKIIIIIIIFNIYILNFSNRYRPIRQFNPKIDCKPQKIWLNFLKLFTPHYRDPKVNHCIKKYWKWSTHLRSRVHFFHREDLLEISISFFWRE